MFFRFKMNGLNRKPFSSPSDFWSPKFWVSYFNRTYELHFWFLYIFKFWFSNFVFHPPPIFYLPPSLLCLTTSISLPPISSLHSVWFKINRIIVNTIVFTRIFHKTFFLFFKWIFFHYFEKHLFFVKLFLIIIFFSETFSFFFLYKIFFS